MGVDASTPKPNSDDEFPITGIPGRYRLIKRVDGRIKETIWRYETADADEWYERRRQEERQREKLETMTLEEVEDEVWGRTERLDQLDPKEIQDRLDSLRQSREPA